MLSDFERKLKQIIVNDRQMQRLTNLDDLEQRTGHSKMEIEQAIDKLKHLRKAEGGLK
ncbi:MAG: hypothetical protein ABF586_06525 [Sporolactobacillus sp.]